MSKNEAAKLKRENEVLRRELENLRSKNVIPDKSGADPESSKPKTNKNSEADVLSFTNFKYLKPDLMRTAFLSLIALALLTAVFAAETTVPQVYSLIKSIKI